ncbi:MAG TPA: Smr/MutS family protein [Reyranella sp.]|nr:Smr/MutS family protein [Reyranella sp.]
MVKDVDLFAAAMGDVKPLAGRKRAAAKAKPPPALRATSPVRRGRVGEGELAALGTSAPELTLDDHNFDRDTARALGRGKLVPQASLDLHGMTLAAAERAVANFLDAAVAQDLRIILIVTGKGARLEGGRVLGGRIRAEFVGWLNRADNRSRVRGVRPAHPRHGGGGAFYVLLRRRSSASSRSLRATPQR